MALLLASPYRAVAEAGFGRAAGAAACGTAGCSVVEIPIACIIGQTRVTPDMRIS
ncbi:hypothetical protein [Effusibacillus pohliae]|uniref:hypothetical protein n=1 Tax=Effusibacillus pohliae TaxID=232270 RepID=UPI00039DA911|nr:hypothetical protein [Effusibacillus pohliae]